MRRRSSLWPLLSQPRRMRPAGRRMARRAASFSEACRRCTVGELRQRPGGRALRGVRHGRVERARPQRQGRVDRGQLDAALRRLRHRPPHPLLLAGSPSGARGREGEGRGNARDGRHVAIGARGGVVLPSVLCAPRRVRRHPPPPHPAPPPPTHSRIPLQNPPTPSPVESAPRLRPRACARWPRHHPALLPMHQPLPPSPSLPVFPPLRQRHCRGGGRGEAGADRGGRCRQAAVSGSPSARAVAAAPRRARAALRGGSDHAGAAAAPGVLPHHVPSRSCLRARAPLGAAAADGVGAARAMEALLPQRRLVGARGEPSLLLR